MSPEAQNSTRIAFDSRAHGAVPFWFWNGDQQEGEISRQLELAAEGGLRGMAIHARVGNQTEYMSERWLALTRHSCNEARRLGLEIWLYDEEGFPSGTVGDRLQKGDPFYQQKLLRFGYQRGTALTANQDLVAVFDAVTFERLNPDAVADDREILCFTQVCLPRYVDALKRETVDRFIQMTHEVYFKALEPYFGDPITHVYTDDLTSYLDRGPSLPWTEALPRTFEDRFGYSLLDRLPALIEAVPGREQVRMDFRTLVMDLFLSEFVSPMHQWCDAHGVRFTGHLNGDEGDVTKSVQRFGSAMAFYEHEHVPGIDDFLCSVSSGRYLDEVRNAQDHCPVVLFKQASSVANQLKDGACSCEVLTFLGWGASMWGQSAFLNYELALGVNVMVHHAFYYATGGVAKRDCPPSYFFQQPYWPHYASFHDAISRSTQLLKRGVYDANTLVIHPMSSCWIAMDGQRCSIGHPFETRTQESLPDPRHLEESLAEVSHELLRLHVGFEYGDEWLLAKHGEIVDGALQVGAMRYDTVILPEISNLLGSTVDLLESLQDAGARLISIRPSADCRIDGALPDSPVFGGRLHPHVIQSPSALRAQGLTPTLDLHLEEEGAPVVVHSRRVDGRKEHFVTNVSDRAQRLRWNEELSVFDPVENVCIDVAAPRLVLPPFHAIHLLSDTRPDAPHRALGETLFDVHEHRALQELETEQWRISRDKENLMLIDWVDDQDDAQDDHEAVADIQYTRTSDVERHRSGSGEMLEVAIEIDAPDCITGILGEAVSLHTMCINGAALPAALREHASSQDLVIAETKGLFRAGANRITFKHLDGDVPFEPFYLMGEFGVDLIDTASGMRSRISATAPRFGDLVDAGLPFYWGRVNYTCSVDLDEDAEWLDCGAAEGVISASLNGVGLGVRYTAPYRFRIGEHRVEGANAIHLVLCNTAQNLYGPHRRDYGVALQACPRRGDGCADYYLAGFGIHGPVTVRA